MSVIYERMGVYINIYYKRINECMYRKDHKKKKKKKVRTENSIGRPQ